MENNNGKKYGLIATIMASIGLIMTLSSPLSFGYFSQITDIPIYLHFIFLFASLLIVLLSILFAIAGRKYHSPYSNSGLILGTITLIILIYMIILAWSLESGAFIT